MSCQHCSQTPEQHRQSHIDTLLDIATLTELGIQNPEVKDLLDQVVRDWRTHALPVCSDFAFN